jgi:hypothetical protein
MMTEHQGDLFHELKQLDRMLRRSPFCRSIIAVAKREQRRRMRRFVNRSCRHDRAPLHDVPGLDPHSCRDAAGIQCSLLSSAAC